MILLSADFIQARLKEKIILQVFEQLSSTNDYLKTIPASDIPYACLAEQQTYGRGRLNRSWYSPYAENIYFSCRYPFQKKMNELSALSLVVGLSVWQTLKLYGLNNEDGGVKWPNDIFYAQQKLAGVLIESEKNQVIIGIGINVNMQKSSAVISKAWTSLRKILGKELDRNLLLIDLIKQLLINLARFDAASFADFKEEWQAADYLFDKTVKFKQAETLVEARVKGLSDEGHLLLQLKDGTISSVCAGEVVLVSIGS
jgi:BirA family transcriptional regulator, biotin operon repressor / biotin---[acetyl-CoA-carboxylase] ligase